MSRPDRPASTPRPEPTRREILTRSVGIMAALVLLVAGVAFGWMYRTALARAEVDLVQLAGAQATLIERIYAGEAARTADSAAAREHALADFAVAVLDFREFGESGELVLGELRGDSIVFLLPERANGGQVPAPIAVNEARSSQLQRAVRGESGVARGLDYRGVEVVGAYRYLPGLKVGLVAKMDVAELQAPFRWAAFVTLVLAVLGVIVGTQLQLWTVSPLIGRVVHRNRALAGELLVADATSERYATLFRSAADPIIIEDLDGVVLEVNEAAVRAFGWSASEMAGMRVETLFPDEPPARLALLRRRAVHGEDVRDEMREARGREGQRLTLLVALTPLRDEKGSVVAVSQIAKDVTALRAAQRALESQNVELERQVEARTADLKRELAVARALAAETRRGHSVGLLGDSAAVRALREQVVAQAAHAQPLLLGGASGAGQETVARAIHERSPRAQGPFLVLDCSRPTTLETPSDAAPDAPLSLRSLLAAAAGGTLYLELVDQLPAEAQEELAAALAPAAHDAVSVRVIAWLNGDVTAAVDAGRLLPELASLLGRSRVTVPALAERREDVVPIAERLLEERARAQGKPPLSFTTRAVERLRDHEWPGNLRELSQVIDALVRGSTGTVVDIAEPLGGRWRSVGGYRLLAPIGQGGMGEVWRAEHSLLKRPAAVKLMRRRSDSVAADRTMLEARFRREAEVTATLNSPHTVQMFDFGVTDGGEFFYVMELLQGMSLADLLKADPAMPAGRAAFLLQQACLSLAEAHARGLVHRDIKPDNLFVCRWLAEADFVKVLDFGIVKKLEDPGTLATKAGLVMGTPAYMAPEVAGGEEATPAADLYALGCVLYRMLTGRRVFEVEGGHMQQMVAHIEQTPTPPSAHAAREIPPALDALVLQLLAKDPAQRPATAMQLHDALGALRLAEAWGPAEARAWWDAYDARGGAPA
jgi:PAS domain S-box-containing protein